jgi:hypothetical protein
MVIQRWWYINEQVRSTGGMIPTGEGEVLGGKPVVVPLYAKQIPPLLTWR